MDQVMTPEQQQQVQQLQAYAIQRKEQAAGILNIGMMCFEKCTSGDKSVNIEYFENLVSNCFEPFGFF